MDEKIIQLHSILQKLIGLHRSLLENVRMEREALLAADLKGIQEATYAKEALVEGMKQQELLRARLIGELVVILRRPARDLTLNGIIHIVQATNMKQADQLRSSLVALTTLAERIAEQNADNKILIEQALGHVHEMKKNVLGEAAPKAETYGSKGQRKPGSSGARFVSKEAY